MSNKGKFQFEQLGELSWNKAGFSKLEQQLFLIDMYKNQQSFRCGDNILAPELLPREANYSGWSDSWECRSAELAFDFLPHLLMRNIISSIGEHAFGGADYWYHGVCVWESGTSSRLLMEEEIAADGCGGTIRIQTQGGEAARLLERISRAVFDIAEGAGLHPKNISASDLGDSAGSEFWRFEFRQPKRG